MVIDLFSRKVIGWSLSKHHDVNLTLQAFQKAYSARAKPNYVLFHSDQKALSILHLHFAKHLKHATLYNLSLERAIPMIMAVAKASSII